MGQDVLVWFKRDLRIADNPVLAQAAARGGRVLPLFIVDPGAWAQADASARQWLFVAESLIELRRELAVLGAPLVIRVGPAQAVLAALCQQTGIRQILCLEETGNGWSYARDRAIAAWARDAGIDWQEHPQLGVVRRLRGRDGWARRRENAMRADPIAPPAALQGFAIDPGGLPTAGDLALPPDPCPGRQQGGRKAGLGLLDSFLDHRGVDYRRAMSAPGRAVTACSRLSPHLAWGTLSPRETAQAAARRKTRALDMRDGWAPALKSFEARLAWRDHFMQKLEDAPRLETRCLHSAYEGLRPATPDAARLAAWQKGETGLPFVDACMRSLIATGWLNFRMRAMLVSVASYQLWLDWRATGPHLARLFTDFEPGIHWPQMQMQSGTTGMNTLRIYNPVKQGQDQDPTGAFTRRWCPELRDLPDAHLHSPWGWPDAARVLDKTYPSPIVDIAAAARQARDAVWAVRQGAPFHAEAARLIDQHASRKDRGAGRHFVDDRSAARSRKRPPRSAAQLRFDF
jgi:deoxyribodipyrimidine photo-lyase